MDSQAMEHLREALLTGALQLDQDGPGSRIRGFVQEQLDEVAPLLPEPEEGAMAVDGATVLFLAGSLLFTVAREDGQLVIKSEDVSRVLGVVHRRDDGHSRWEFRFRHRDELCFNCNLHDPEAAGTELFARRVAQHAWGEPSPS